MVIDVVRCGHESILSLASVHGITNFKKDYSHWFDSGHIYIRYVGKNVIGSWRYLPNKSTNFYRCPKVTSQLLIEKLNLYFVTSIIKIYDKGNNNESI